MDTTQHDLKILSMCYYIMAGIIGASVLLMGVYVSFIGAVIANLAPTTTRGNPFPAFLPGLIAGIGALLVGFGLLCAGCMAGAAWSMPQRRNYPLVMIAAVLNCIHIPFGTALAVFTFAVLNRPGVRESFRTGHLVAPVSPPPLPPATW